MTKPRLKPVLVTAASAALVTLAEAKAHLRVDHSDEDSYIQSLINAAVSYLDGFSGRLGRAILEQTWRVDFEAFADELRLPVGDIIAVSSVSYYDQNNVQQTLASTVYQLLTDGLGSYLALKPGQVWPAVYVRSDAVRVTWTAGFGATASSVPAGIKHAALLLVAHWYDNRSAVNVGNITSDLPFTVDALLAPFNRNVI
jgi:uncharacterized phiE125 gp8 family phage protein